MYKKNRQSRLVRPDGRHSFVILHVVNPTISVSHITIALYYEWQIFSIGNFSQTIHICQQFCIQIRLRFPYIQYHTQRLTLFKQLWQVIHKNSCFVSHVYVIIFQSIFYKIFMALCHLYSGNVRLSPMICVVRSYLCF